MYFEESVRGLNVGAPVLLRGIPVGKITDINLEIDAKSGEIHIPVVVEVEPDRIVVVNKQANLSTQDNIERLMANGLRAQLQTGSLLTGQLYIGLDLFPQSKIITHKNKTGYPEFPTVPGSFNKIIQSTQAFMDKISKLPLEAISTEINNTLVSLQSSSKAATKTLDATTGTMGHVDKTMDSAQKVLSTLEPGSTTQYELNQLLKELTQATISVRQLSDYLEEHPDSLIRGKKEK